MFKEKGVSLISLIITIIVIIISAAVVIFSGMDAPESAQFAKFSSDIDNMQNTVDGRYSDMYTEYALQGKVIKNDEIYRWIATGEFSGDSTERIVDIDLENNQLHVAIPKYEGKTWRMNLDTGEVVIDPPHIYKGKMYASVGDIKNKDIAGGNNNGGSQSGNGNEDQPGGGEETEDSIVALVKNGKIKVGDFVDYKPAGASTSMTVSESENGYAYNPAVSAYDGDWVVFATNKSTGDVLITMKFPEDKKQVAETAYSPEDFPSGVYIKGSIGYNNGISLLNKIAKTLYSNTTLGLQARSMTLEDIIVACPEIVGTQTERTYTSGTFYSPATGGTPSTDAKGNACLIASEENPVTVKATVYSSSMDGKAISDILGGSASWLATHYVNNPSWDTSEAYGGLYTYTSYVYGKTISYEMMFTSSEPDYNWNDPAGVRPVVTLNSSIKVDVSDTTSDGTSAFTAWKLTK